MATSAGSNGYNAAYCKSIHIAGKQITTYTSPLTHTPLLMRDFAYIVATDEINFIWEIIHWRILWNRLRRAEIPFGGLMFRRLV